MDIVSSRTPEGWPGRCRACGREVTAEPSPRTHDATCPHCGGLVWLERPANPVRIAAWVLACVAGGWLALAVARAAGAGVPEFVVLAVLGVVLFGRHLPNAVGELWKRSRA